MVLGGCRSFLLLVTTGGARPPVLSLLQCAFVLPCRQIHCVSLWPELSRIHAGFSSAKCRFSHNVTKIETTRLLILLRFNFMMYKTSLKLLFIQSFAANEFLVLR